MVGAIVGLTLLQQKHMEVAINPDLNSREAGIPVN